MGEVFAGRYELVDPIGRGGTGAVWRAWDHRRRRYVAAKVLQQSDAHTLLRFVREQALRIDHPHVLAPASWAADDDKVLFTMDLVKGGSLAHVIGDYGPLSPRYVCTLLDQLLSGLTAVHAEGVVHRDIKPANILLEATGTGRPHLRLSDFGIAMRKGEPRLTETNYVVGTPGYFAPEQMLGDEPDFPGDLFAVGLVALYLLEGAKPDSRALIEHFAEHGTPDAPQGVPEPLWQVIATLLQPDPEARFRTATGARKALSAAVDLLPEPGPDDELVEIFDQLGPLPTGFGPDGPAKRSTTPLPPSPPGRPPTPSDTGSFHLPPPPGRPTPTPPPPAPLAPPQPSTPPTPMPVQAPSAAGPLPSSVPAQPSDSPHTPPHTPAAGQANAPAPQPPAPAPQPAHVPSHTSTAAVQREYPPTRPYTAQRPQVPTQAAPLPQEQSAQPHLTQPQAPGSPAAQAPAPQAPAAQASTAHARTGTPTPTPTPTPASAPAAHRRRKRRPGPPAKVTVPVLLLALLSFAVGFWALARI
ncbi:serine/threonine-protein kinase [Streptomyces monticola]|uniref:non-specific serine/threonine protein kinase n=1 Tax=Streptomyces monticola TaxID=2666263 RepID=A0ABW2JKP1_9ACTN